jgi:peroxiredoxin
LTAYRSRYAEIEKLGARVVAISTDDLETQRRFKAELAAPFPFVADVEGKLVALYDVKVPVLTYANRVTFVIDKSRRIVKIERGGDAIDPSSAIGAAKLSCEAP